MIISTGIITTHPSNCYIASAARCRIRSSTNGSATEVNSIKITGCGGSARTNQGDIAIIRGNVRII